MNKLIKIIISCIFLIVLAIGFAQAFSIQNENYIISGVLNIQKSDLVSNSNYNVFYNTKNGICFDPGIDPFNGCQGKGFFVFPFLTPNEPDSSQFVCEGLMDPLNLGGYYWQPVAVPNGCCGDDWPEFVYTPEPETGYCEGTFSCVDVNTWEQNELYYDDFDLFPVTCYDTHEIIINGNTYSTGLDGCACTNMWACNDDGYEPNCQGGFVAWVDDPADCDDYTYGNCGGGASEDTVCVCEGTHILAEDILTNVECTLNGYEWVNTTQPPSEPTSISFNDLYYADPLSQYFCSVTNADDMVVDLTNEDTITNWNWLDAYNEEYVIHNAQLQDENINIVSNSDNWYVCNATGNAKDVLNFEDNYTVDNFDVLPREGDRIGNCPQGWYYCNCINDTGDNNPNADTPFGCVDEDFDYQSHSHKFYPKCVASPYLCNSDFDFDSDIDSTTIDQCGTDMMSISHPQACTDGEEMFGPYIDYFNPNAPFSDQYNNESCPGECFGFPDIEPNTPFNPPGATSGNLEILKSECSNANAGNCFGSGISGFFENTEDLCENGDDDDGDCCISGYTNGICAIGQDTNGDGDICKEGDIGVDCLDADCINAGWCDGQIPEDFEYQCNDSIDNDGDCCNDRDEDGGLNLPYYQPGSTVECTSGFPNSFDDICRVGAFNTDCMDSDCLTSAQCVESYGGLGTFAAPKNHSVICYERSGNSLFTECCDNYGLSCFNGIDQNNVLVDRNTEFVGRGVPLYVINTFDRIKEGNIYVDYVQKYNNDLYPITIFFYEDPNSGGSSNLDIISQDIFSYYKTLEFDVGFTSLEAITITFNYKNSISEDKNITITPDNFNNYSMNGDQDYRWHHVVIDLPIDAIRFEDISFTLDNNENILFDNIFFGVDPINEDLSKYQNYKCAGAFGFWIDEFDPIEVAAPEMSCQDVDQGDLECTACDWVNVSHPSCHMSDLVDTPSSTEWYDFDPFKYVCDSYLSFGWSGTKCCGDDTNQTNKEFYWDYKGACWDGYNVIDNQRMGDVLYFNDEENELNKFLFHKNFSVCNEPAFELDEDYANANEEYIGLDSAIEYTLAIGGDQYKINMYNNSVCDVKGNYYCSGTNNLWRDDVLGVPDWRPSDFLYLKDGPYNSEGCCPSDYCWNGEICIHATVYEDNSSMPAFNRNFEGPDHIPFNEIENTEGYRCVFDEAGYAVWEDATAKYDWNLNETGYCKKSNYCFVDENFQFLNTTRYNYNVVVHNDGCCDKDTDNVPFDGEYEVGENTSDCLFIAGDYYNVSDFACQGVYDCVPTGATVTDDLNINISGNYYCDNGNWTSKSSQIASKMCEWFECSENEFSLSCDNSLAFNLNFTNEDEIFSDLVHSACVYQLGDADDVAVGFALRNKFEDSGLLLETSLFNSVHSGVTVDCDPANTISNGLIACQYSGAFYGNYNFYYDNQSNFLLVSTDLPEDYLNNWFNGLTNFIYGVFHPSFSSDFFVLTGNSVYDKLFMAHNSGSPNLQVMAAQEYKYDEKDQGVINRIFVNYSNNFDLSNHLNNTISYGLFEKESLLQVPVMYNPYLVEDIIFNKCNDEGFLLIKKPNVWLVNEPDFNKQDMLWTYLTKTLRLNSEYSGGSIYTSDVCSECNSNDDCDTGLECDNFKCRIISGSGISCNFNEECLTGTCKDNNQCSFCGNDLVDVDEGEQCDGLLLAPPNMSASCEFYGYTGGILQCSSTCQHDTSECTNSGGGGSS